MRTYIKPRAWNGRALTGLWSVTIKVDGVRALWNGSEWRSRADKPLYNIPPWEPGLSKDCEVFVGSFRDTIRATRTKHLKPDTPAVMPEHLYGLDPLDYRLEMGAIRCPSPDQIIDLMNTVIGRGFEGLVLRQGDTWLKVKPEETFDVPITGWGEGEGKHVGRLGFLVTPMGEVGTGFSDEEREMLWAEAITTGLGGQMIEVSCMHLTPDGMFRHPRFVRMRPDKSNEQRIAH